MAGLRESDPGTPLSIVSITSVSAVLASTNRAAYCMAKAGLSMMSQVLAVRLAEFNISVYEIQPGVIETDMTEKVKSIYQERIEKGLTLEPRMGQPEDIGKVVAALLRGDLPYATGQILALDGGMMVGRL
jgi:NAD(P)-dependent dehydrogenase (short-subunit alcohol dehydrogenase family)